MSPDPICPSELTALPGQRKKLLYPSCEQTGRADILDANLAYRPGWSSRAAGQRTGQSTSKSTILWKVEAKIRVCILVVTCSSPKGAESERC